MDSMAGISVRCMSSQWSVCGDLSNMSEVSVIFNGAGTVTDSGVANGVGRWGSVGSQGVHRSGMSVHWGSVQGLNGMDCWCCVGNMSWGSNVGWGSVNGMSVDSGGGLGDNGVKSMNIIGSVVDGTDGAVSFDKRVLSLDNISIANLMLGLDITGVTVGYSVVERVLGMRVLNCLKNVNG